MIAKSILAGVILATAAGAFVYFDGDYSNDSASSKTETVTLRAPATIDDSRTELAGADSDEENPSLSQTPAPQTTYEDADIVKPKTPKNIPDAASTDKTPSDVPSPVPAADGRSVQDQNIDVTVNSDEKTMTVTVTTDGEDAEVEPEPPTNLIDRVMAETLKISVPDLRDRAYLDIVSYALKTEDFVAANTALQKIEQVELRDTARNRMAITHALNNDADSAFAIIEDLEVDALRDVIRLQVIEALIAPELLPQEMR